MRRQPMVLLAVITVSALLGVGCADATSSVGRQPASVEVSPSTVALTLGGVDSTRQLTAVVRDGDGQPMDPPNVTWASSNGSIAAVSATGSVRAVAAGSAEITARRGDLLASAAVTVVPAAPGVTILLDETFEDDNFAARGWYDFGPLTLTTTNPGAGTRSLVARFAPGATLPSWGGARLQFTPTASVYLRYRVRYSDNWVGSGQPFQPHEFYLLTTESGAFAGPARSRLTVYVEHNYQSGGIPVVAWQDGVNIDETRVGQNLVGVTEARAVAGCNGNPDGYPSSCYTVGTQRWNWKAPALTTPVFSNTPGPTYKGNWRLVEAFFQMNSIVDGVARNDGIARYWIDGVEILNISNVQFRTGARPNQRFNQLFVSPYIGDGSPVDQTMWLDDIRIATGRP